MHILFKILSFIFLNVFFIKTYASNTLDFLPLENQSINSKSQKIINFINKNKDQQITRQLFDDVGTKDNQNSIKLWKTITEKLNEKNNCVNILSMLDSSKSIIENDIKNPRMLKEKNNNILLLEKINQTIMKIVNGAWGISRIPADAQTYEKLKLIIENVASGNKNLPELLKNNSKITIQDNNENHIKHQLHIVSIISKKYFLERNNYDVFDEVRQIILNSYLNRDTSILNGKSIDEFIFPKQKIELFKLANETTENQFLQKDTSKKINDFFKRSNIEKKDRINFLNYFTDFDLYSLKLTDHNNVKNIKYFYDFIKEASNQNESNIDQLINEMKNIGFFNNKDLNDDMLDEFKIMVKKSILSKEISLDLKNILNDAFDITINLTNSENKQKINLQTIKSEIENLITNGTLKKQDLLEQNLTTFFLEYYNQAKLKAYELVNADFISEHPNEKVSYLSKKYNIDDIVEYQDSYKIINHVLGYADTQELKVNLYNEIINQNPNLLINIEINDPSTFAERIEFDINSQDNNKIILNYKNSENFFPINNKLLIENLTNFYKEKKYLENKEYEQEENPLYQIGNKIFSFDFIKGFIEGDDDQLKKATLLSLDKQNVTDNEVFSVIYDLLEITDKKKIFRVINIEGWNLNQINQLYNYVDFALKNPVIHDMINKLKYNFEEGKKQGIDLNENPKVKTITKAEYDKNKIINEKLFIKDLEKDTSANIEKKVNIINHFITKTNESSELKKEEWQRLLWLLILYCGGI